jgi:hypothetical protein
VESSVPNHVLTFFLQSGDGTVDRFSHGRAVPKGTSATPMNGTPTRSTVPPIEGSRCRWHDVSIAGAGSAWEDRLNPWTPDS